MKWIIRDPKRLLREREEIEKLSAEVDWIRAVHWRLDKETLALMADLDITIHGIVREVDLTYPDAFPDTPAYIRPRDRTQQWSIHQYGEGGSFCLEWRADNWHSEVTGADLIRSFYKLLSTEQHPEQPMRVPSAHRLTRGQAIQSSARRLVTTPGLAEAIAAMPLDAAVPIRTRTLLHTSVTVCFVTEVGNADGSFNPVFDVPKGISSYFPLCAWTCNGFAIRSSILAPKTNVRTVDDLLALIGQLGVAEPIALVREPGLSQFGDVLLVITDEDGAPRRAWGIDDGEIHAYAVVHGADSAARLPSAHARLKDIRVAILGLGSLGSKVAISLGRAGCRKFVLVDDDIFLPENVCRNELSWDSIGVHKVHAVEEALTLIAPDVDVDIRVHRLAGQEPSITAASVLKAVSCCEMIIDASAKPEVFTLLAAIAKTNRRPMCWGEVFAGGIGGLIARANPHAGPNPLAVRNAILSHLATLPPAPYVNATRYDIDDGEPIVADDADVSQIASALTRMALDTLLERQPTAFSHSAYLIGLRKEWIFDHEGAFETFPIDVTGEGWDSQEPTAEDRADALAMLVKLLNEEANDYAGPAPPDSGCDQSGAA